MKLTAKEKMFWYLIASLIVALFCIENCWVPMILICAACANAAAAMLYVAFKV